MPRCPQCNHFVSVEPVGFVENIDIEWDAEEKELKPYVNGTLRIVKRCAECEEELEDTFIDFDQILEGHSIEKSEEEKHELEVEVDEEEIEGITSVVGKGRGAKTYYGAEVNITINCSCGKTFHGNFHLEEQASNFDSLV